MIISFGFNGAGGGGGTSDYSQLSNKPSINGVTLNGNQSSSDLGITSESLEPVAIVPSGASVGEIYATTKSQTVGYGWEEIENGWAFNCSLNPASGDTSVDIGQLVGNGDSTNVTMFPNGYTICFGDGTNIGFTRRAEFDGGYVNINYYDYNRIEFTFEGIDVPTLQNAIASASTTIVENKTVQVEATNVPLAHWEFWTQYQGRYQDIQFWLEQNGQKDFLPNTELGLFSYYQLYFKLYTNADGFFCVDYSNDSAVTWNHYIQNANIPVSEPEYYPIDITDPNGKQALFKAWFRSGDGNFGVIIKSNKYLWLDNYVTPNGVLTKDLLKEGYSYESLSELPQINGVELKGNKSTEDLGITVGKLDGDKAQAVQTLVYSADGSDVAGKKGFVIEWDGHSDMLYTAEALQHNWGSTTRLSPYYSGGTWYGVKDWRDNGHKFEILPGNKLYYHCVVDSSNWYFDGNYSGATELHYCDDILTAATGTVQVSYTDTEIPARIVIDGADTAATVTFNVGSDEVVLDAAEVFGYFFTGGTLNGNPLTDVGGYFVDMLSDGLHMLYVYQNSASIYTIGGWEPQAWDDIHLSKSLPITNLEVNAGSGYMNIVYGYGTARDYGTYQYNGYLWDKLAKNDEIPAPAAGGVQTHWVLYTDSQTYAMEGKCSYVRGDIVSNGDYYCNVGQIDGEQKALWASISNGAITGVGGQLYSNEINGHYYITVKDSSENTYGAQCWVDNGKLYWQVYGTTIVHLDNSELGTNWEAGFIY